MKAPKFKIEMPFTILWFDTEQGKEDIRRLGNMVLLLSSSMYKSPLRQYSLRGLSPPLKMMLITKIVQQVEGVAIIVIDNLRDLCYDINNQKEALEVILTIQQLADLGHHIMLVLHVTRGTEEAARGAIGTEAMNRGENVYATVKDGDKTIIKPVVTRGKTFEEFAFQVNAEGIPFLIEDWIKTPSSTGKLRQKLSPASIIDEDHKEVVNEIFLNEGRSRFIKRSDLVTSLQTCFQKKGVSVGESKAREFISYLIEKKLILKTSRIIGTRKVELYCVEMK